MNELSIKDFEKAWDDKTTLIYPEKPCEYGQRWFIRTEVNPNGKGNLLLIGINPSSATRLAPEYECGDPTTTKICTHINFSEWERVTLVNLTPLVNSKPSNLNSAAVRETHNNTNEIIKKILPEVDTVLLMWGNPKNTDWKENAIDNLRNAFSKSKDLKIIGFPSSTNKFPCHPGYGGLDYWTCMDKDGNIVPKKTINFSHLLITN